MGAKTQQPAYTEYTEQVCEDAPARSGPSNSDQIAKLTQGGTSAPPPVDLGAVTDGPSFAKAAGDLLEALVPGPGSFASMRIAGKFPFYTAAAATAFFEPALQLQAGRTGAGKLEVMIASQIGLRAEAGIQRQPWWPGFVTYVKGFLKGSLKLVGDTAGEIFKEFLVVLAEAVEMACAAVGGPVDAGLKDGLLGGQYQSYVQAMGKGDSITAGLGGGVEGGVDAPVVNGAIGADLTLSRTFENTDGDGDLEVSEATSLTFAGQAVIAKLGLTVPANVTFVMKQGKLDEWYVGLGASTRMSLGAFSKEMLIGAAWAEGFVNALANLIRTTATKAKLDGAALADLVAGISIGGDALAYTALGSQLKAAAATPAFAEKAGQEVSIALDGQGGWSFEKGANVRVALSTAETWSLGEEGVTPLYVEAKSGDTIVSVDASSKQGTSLGT